MIIFWQAVLDQGANIWFVPAESQQTIVADLLFDHDVGLGMEIVRFNFGASSTDANAVRSMRPFGAVPCVMLQDGTYNWTLVRILLLMYCDKARLQLLFAIAYCW